MGLFDDFIDEVGDTKYRNYKPGCGISCNQCSICESPKLCKTARRKGGILFLLDTPVRKQDTEGDVWYGSFKKYVLPILKECHVDVENEVSVAFAVPCYGIDVMALKGDAYEVQMESCRPMLDKVISKADPSLIIPMGKVAFRMIAGSFDGRMRKVTFMEDFCFNLIPDQSVGRWIAPCIAPKYLAEMFKMDRRRDDAVFYYRRLHDFLTEVLTSDYHKFPDTQSWADGIHICHTESEAVRALEFIEESEPEYLAFDYETDGLKLEREDRGIIMVGFSCKTTTYAMPFYQDSERFCDLMRKILTDRNIGKIAHHAKYEARCSLDKLGVLPHPWAWDTMYSARLLNNVCKANLKFQTYINFGISGYDTMEGYMAPSAEDVAVLGDNAMNTFRKACEDPKVMDVALRYVGQDALYTYKLFEVHKEKVSADKHLAKGEKLFRSFINPLVKTEVNGIAIDTEVLDASIEACTEKLEAAEKAIKEDSYLKKFWPSDEHEFSYTTDDLTKLLYDYGGVKVTLTDKGKYADDAETLEEIGLPICRKVLDARKYSKILDTYLMNIKRESVYDRKRDETLLHSSFNLHIASTFRSSSSGGINMQNIPVREKEQNQLIRSCMVPPKGAMIWGFDYRAMEVGVGTCIHHDKNMLSFLENDGDMHRASAMGCMMYTEEEWEAEDPELRKVARQAAKKFNFASFYGSYYKQTGATLWKFIQKHPKLIEHLKEKGVETEEEYLEHMKTMDEDLWERQFPQYGQWRKDEYKFYQTHGYVDLITGFRCYGPMSKNNSTNSGIQGPAAHVLLWALSKVHYDLIKHNLRSFLINEIHDAMYLAVYPDEAEEVVKIIRKWMIEEPPKHFKWCTAPLAVELEYTKLREEGGNWAEMYTYGYI